MTASETSIGIAGLGLIGGSLLFAAHHHGFAAVGFDASTTTRSAARRAGYAVVDDVEELTECDLLVLAVPLPALEDLLPKLSGYRGLLTDVTSVKEPVRQLVVRHCPQVRFVGGHPMTGKASSGFASAARDLFDDCAWVLCLDADTGMDDVAKLAELVCALTARVVPSTSRDHDAAVARISHVPHVAAGAITLLAADPLSRTLAAGSFTDATRVAQTRPELVAAMCTGNAEPVREELDRLIAELTAARDRLSSPDRFRDWYAPAHRQRRDWPPAPRPWHTVPITRNEFLAVGAAGGWICAIDRAADSATVRQQPS